MSPEEFTQQLDQRLQKFDEMSLVFQIAANTHAMQVERIFGRGEKASGPIGNYSVKPMYAGKKQFNGGSFVGIGKSGKTNFKSGKLHQSMFLTQGYKQLRDTQGYESDFVNLTYSADLKQDFAASLTISNGSVFSGVSNPENVAKLEGLMLKYGDDLFDLSDEEKNYLKTEVAKAVNDYLRGSNR